MSNDHANHDMPNIDHLAMGHGSMVKDSDGHDYVNMGMAMYYHFSSIETILFKFWNIKSPLGVVISFILVVLFCFLLESIRWIRLSWRQKIENVRSEQYNEESFLHRVHLITCPLVGDFALHAMQLFLSYSLMMIFMTFNVWLCTAVVLGEASAHLFFRVMLSGLDRTVGVVSGSCG